MKLVVLFVLLAVGARAQCGDLGTVGNPAADCQQLKDCGAASGTYYLSLPAYTNPESTKTWGAEAATVYCENDRLGGGWAVVLGVPGGVLGNANSGASLLSLWTSTADSDASSVVPDWNGGPKTRRVQAHAFNYYSSLGGVEWVRFATLYQNDMEVPGSHRGMRMGLGAGVTYHHLTRRAPGTAASDQCEVLPGIVQVFDDDEFLGKTQRSVGVLSSNRGLAGVSDTCGQSTASCSSTAPDVDDACPVVSKTSNSVYRISHVDNSQGTDTSLNSVRHLVGYTVGSTGSDSTRCTFVCWSSTNTNAGYGDVSLFAYRPGKHGPTPTLAVHEVTAVPILVNVSFDQNVDGLVAGDFAVSGGSATNLQTVDARNYVLEVMPSGAGSAVTVDLASGQATGSASGVGNNAADQLSFTANSCSDATSLGNTTDSEPVLDTAASGIYNDEVKVVFTESVKYENTQFFFGSSSCGVDHFTWVESSVDASTCVSTWTGTASWADFTANCDLGRTESAIESVDHIIYQANFHITHTETFDGLRPGDDPITRTITQYMPFEVRLPTSVTATTSPVRIFAPVAVEAAILEQGVSGTPGGDMTGRVGFLTSVQYPFRLGSVTGVTTPAGVATSDADPSTWVGHGQVGTCNDDSAAPCTQFFEWSFSPASGAICELDGEYNVTLEVECQVSQVNDCPLDPNPGSVTLSFTLDTTDFCVELVDDLSVSASLETYLSDDFLVVKHDFIDGQRIYAQAPTQAEVSLSATKVVQVSLIKPDASEIFFLNQGSPALTTEGTQVDLVTVDGAAVGPAQNSLPSFNFLADSELFGIAADQSDFITLKARIELSYDNAGQAKRESRDLEWTVQATTSSGTVATSFAMSGSNAVATQGTGTSASTSSASAATVAGVNVLFMGAALVVMCTVLVAAVVISRGRAKIDALREQLAAKAQA